MRFFPLKICRSLGVSQFSLALLAFSSTIWFLFILPHWRNEHHSTANNAVFQKASEILQNIAKSVNDSYRPHENQRMCPPVPPRLKGPLVVEMSSPGFEEIAKANPLLKPGGYYRPPECSPRNGPTAIIIPYRNRELHLRAFLHYMHPILQRQQLEYTIIVVEQAGDEQFNRAVLLNIGYKESLDILPGGRQFQCYVFHDVDLLPETDSFVYTCKEEPIHMSGYLANRKYSLQYEIIFGGVSAIPKDKFEKINGYSNVFFGWGGEDDEIRQRLRASNIAVRRPSKENLSYKMIQHARNAKDISNVNHMAIVRMANNRMGQDGINSLVYRRLKRNYLPTHIHILVEFSKDEIFKAANFTEVTKAPLTTVKDLVTNISAPRHRSLPVSTPHISTTHQPFTTELKNLELCPENPPKLVGPLAVTFEEPSFEELSKANPLLQPGGYYRPSECLPRHGPTAFIIPYRNRENHLRAFLHQIHPILQRQLLEYRIIVVEQAGNGRFNRALLMNIGFNESLHLLPNNRSFQCYAFHDVDLIPEDDRGIFTCKDFAIHLSGYIDKFNYILPYVQIFGGASAIPRQFFDKVNGYSNAYFGWGGEDDDMYERLRFSKIQVKRMEKDLLRYKMIKHKAEANNLQNDDRWHLLKKTVERMHYDGLSSLKYKLIKRDEFPTYTHLVVEFTEEEVNVAVFGKSSIRL